MGVKGLLAFMESHQCPAPRLVLATAHTNLLIVETLIHGLIYIALSPFKPTAWTLSARGLTSAGITPLQRF